MPQFDITTFPSQIFWLVVSFAVLYAIMATLVLPRIGSTVEARERKIQADLDAAQQANDAARTTAAAQDKALAEARGRAEAVIRAASDAAAAETSAQMHTVARARRTTEPARRGADGRGASSLLLCATGGPTAGVQPMTAAGRREQPLSLRGRAHAVGGSTVQGNPARRSS